MKYLQYWNRMPVEWFVLTLPALIFLLLGYLRSPFGLEVLPTGIQLVAGVASYMFWFLSIVLLLYLLVRLFSWVVFSVLKLAPIESDVQQVVSYNVLGSVLKILLMYISIFFLISVSLKYIFLTVNGEWVQEVSSYYLDIDIWLLGPEVYARIIEWFTSHALVELLTLNAYTYLTPAIGLVVMLLALRSVHMLRGFIMATLLCLLISFPFWLLLPAVSPTHYMLEGVFTEVVKDGHVLVGQKIDDSLINTSGRYMATREQLIAVWTVGSTEGQSLYFVSSNPSFHVAAGVVCVYFLWKVSLALGLLALVYQIFNMMGTVLLLQHYIVDVPAGVAVAFVGIVISNFALGCEKNHLQVNNVSYFYVLYQFLHHTKNYGRFLLKK